MEIIVKRYEHFNTALPNWNTPKGVHVKSKDHYDRLVKENNMIPYEESVQREKNKKMKEYVPSEHAKAIVKDAIRRRDSNGQVRLDSFTKMKMEKLGIKDHKIPDYMKLPQKYQPKGEFGK